MASQKSGREKAAIKLRGEGAASGASSSPSNKGRSRSVTNALTVAQLQTLEELKFEQSTKGAQGSSGSASSNFGPDKAARVIKGSR